MKEPSRDHRLRRIATARGYTASKSKVRDRAMPGFGRWTVTGPDGSPVSPEGGWTTRQAEQWLARMGAGRD